MSSMKRISKYFTFIALFGLNILGIYSCVKEHNNNFIESTKLKTIVLDSWGNGTPNLLINIPADYIIIFSKGPDFDLHHIVPADTTKTSSVRMSIYVGHNPNNFADKQKDNAIIKKITSNGVTWDYWYSISNRDTVYNCERIIYNFYKGTNEENLKVHIFIKAKYFKFLNDFLDYSNSLKLEKNK
jgi:hypothetical protein